MWIRALLLMVALASGCIALGGCKKEKKQVFSCHTYQKRMERCENAVLGALKKRYDNDVKTGFRKAHEAEAQFKMLQWRIRKQIRYKNSERLCDKLQKLRTPHYRKQLTTMKYCWQRPGCDAFAECLIVLW